jgi:hypothetical protein
MSTDARPAKITFGEMRASGVRGLLIYCSDYRAALKAAIDRNWLTIHRSGVYVTFTQAGADMFA